MKFTTNVFCNTCVGGFMMRYQNAGNNNPFVWTIAEFDSIKNLITNFDNIDWLNYKISVKKHPQKSFPVYVMTIDDQIDLWFVHVIQDDRFEKPTKDGKLKTDVNIRVKDVKAYLEDCYLRRIERMLEQNIEPTFIITDFNITFDQMKELDKIETPYSKMFVLSKKQENNPLSRYIIARGHTFDVAQYILTHYGIIPEQAQINSLESKKTTILNKPVKKPVLKPVIDKKPVIGTKYRIKTPKAPKTPKKPLPTIMSGSKVARILYT